MKKRNGQIGWLGTAAALAAAAACVIAGLMMGQQLEVMTKAVNICLECVGLG